MEIALKIIQIRRTFLGRCVRQDTNEPNTMYFSKSTTNASCVYQKLNEACWSKA